jgi:glucose-6-phosphate isomerase
MIDVAGIRLDISGTSDHLTEDDLLALAPRVTAAADSLAAGTCPGADFLGWLDLPENVGLEEFAAVEAEAAKCAADSEVLVVVGIGGSYLGARAVLDALGGPAAGRPEILFAGTGVCATPLQRVLDRVAGRDFRICVVSKSGTTLEPAVAFRLLRDRLEKQVGAEAAARRITAVTDARRGALRSLAEQNGYATFVIPDDVGGRFSVLTPVGLVPLAVAGVDVRGLVAGARAMRVACQGDDLFANPAHLYAAARHLLSARGFTTEILSTFHDDLRTLQEWWKQLFGESEGKDGKGIFPAATVFTGDLHSLETFLTVGTDRPDLVVPDGPEIDGLGYLAGRSLDEINRKAFEGTRRAHIAGGVPCMGIELARLDAASIGSAIYLFEKAVAVRGLLDGVNPFDQPGVETYKNEMFRLLGKPE